MKESDLLRAVIDLAHLRGWRASHALPALTRGGRWHTATQGDRGAPDLLLAKGGRVLHVELKAERGTYGEGQPEWAAAIGETHRLWRPCDLRDGTIQRELAA